jgi:hypothetical protein
LLNGSSLHISCVVFSLTPKMGTVYSSEMSVNFYQKIRRHYFSVFELVSEVVISGPIHNSVVNELHGAESFLRNRQLRSYSIISQHFMEPEGSLPCSQEP